MRVWWRVLVWGVFLSLLVHWMVLDLFRLGLMHGMAQTASALHVTLDSRTQTSPSAVEKRSDGTRQTVARASGQPHPAGTGQSTSARAEDRSVESPATPSASGVTTHPNQNTLSGLRSGKPEEALVAMRIALVEALKVTVPAAVQRQELWCDYDAAGRLTAVRGPLEWMSVVRMAAASLHVPEVLAGQPFSLDIVIEN